LIQNGIGFPLDDAWIHQTYARNLLQNGSWSFVPGEISGGSTSPLWTLFLALGFVFKGNGFYYWTLAISIASLCGLVYLLCRSLLNLDDQIQTGKLFLFGLVAAMEWHLQWSAASGMETILFSLFIVILFFITSKKEINWLLVGLFSGLIVWIRPDGLTLFGPICFVIIQAILERKFDWKKLLKFLLPCMILIGGYILFNLLTTGQVFPNTFYAKQKEYSELLKFPVWQRIINEFSPIWIGVCSFLIPGFIYKIVQSIHHRNYGVLGFLIWVIGYVTLFAIRLPVIYQHGRYVIPVIPLFVLLGFSGTLGLLELIRKEKFKSIAIFALASLFTLVSVAFFVKGIDAYRTDLKVIDQFMVQPAKWMNKNTDSTAVIAVHDIGAMGFYSDRKLIDLAGLINPEVIPFIQDETRIYAYLEENKADYFVGFSDWYMNSRNWGQVIQSFNMIVDEKFLDVDIIKLKY
jgi:hypothetical protein